MMTKSLLTACAIALFSFGTTSAATISTDNDIQTAVDTNDKIGQSLDFYYNVKANTTVTWEYTFRANTEAKVTVNGDGDTDIDVFIYDENGNLITKDDDTTDYCICRWTPKWTGKFTIKVKNLGNVYNRCHLLIP